jgi:hypothetical protein
LLLCHNDFLIRLLLTRALVEAELANGSNRKPERTDRKQTVVVSNSSHCRAMVNLRQDIE